MPEKWEWGFGGIKGVRGAFWEGKHISLKKYLRSSNAECWALLNDLLRFRRVVLSYSGERTTMIIRNPKWLRKFEQEHEVILGHLWSQIEDSSTKI